MESVKEDRNDHVWVAVTLYEWFYSFNTLKQPSKWWKYVKICSYADSGPWWWGARSFDGLGTVTNGFSTKNGVRGAVIITDFYDLVFSGPRSACNCDPMPIKSRLGLPVESKLENRSVKKLKLVKWKLEVGRSWLEAGRIETHERLKLPAVIKTVFVENSLACCHRAEIIVVSVSNDQFDYLGMECDRWLFGESFGNGISLSKNVAKFVFAVPLKQGRIHGHQLRTGGQGRKCAFFHFSTRADGRTDQRTDGQSLL